MKDLNKVNNLTGRKFGRLSVIGIDDKSERRTYWICQCDCGALKSVRSDSLQNGSIRSCGCLKKEQDKINLGVDRGSYYKGKMHATRLYDIWNGMKMRCNNPRDVRYHRYGGRGIAVCDDWKNDFLSFYNWALDNGYSDELTIDRIDNDKNYCPENCRWSTIKEQCRNRSTNVKITIGNATKTLTEWCEIFELDYKMIIARYHRNGNISIDELFNK